MNIVMIAILVLLIGYVSYVYTKLSGVAKNYHNQQEAMDTILEKRYKIFKHLIEVFRKDMDIDKSNLGEIETLREKSLQAKKEKDEKTRIGMEDKMSHIASGISFIFEQHQHLKQNQQAHDAHDELVKTEEELARHKEQINQIVDQYHKVNSGLLPWLISKTFAKQLNVNCESWHINSDAAGEKEKYTVQM